MSKYTEWRNKLWKLTHKIPKNMNCRTAWVRHRLSFNIKQALLKSYQEYNDYITSDYYKSKKERGTGR